jgi:hypothetical protein
MCRTILVVILGAITGMAVTPVFAREPPNFDIREATVERRATDRSPDRRHRYRKVHYRGHPYFYRAGRYYRRHNGVYFMVNFPIGIDRSPDYVVVEGPREPEPARPQPRPEPDVYIHAQDDQTTAQLQRDRYECELWSARDAAYDPARDGKLIRDVPFQDNPSRGATVAGTVAGAIAGSVIADSGKGIAIGATLGTIIGAAAESSGERKQREDGRKRAQAMERYSEFKRAFGECMAGRGYAVR